VIRKQGKKGGVEVDGGGGGMGSRNISI